VSAPTTATGRAAVLRWLPWFAMAVVLAGCFAIGIARDDGPQTAQDRVAAIARTIKCPTCQGESVGDSNAASSRAIRADIAQRVGAGESDEQIRAAYVASYGQEILLTPSGSGVSALVWAIPVVVLALGVAGLVAVFVRWRDEPVAPVTAEDRALVDEAIHHRAEIGPDDDGGRRR
jgi:cytochrome c-type biogenesis protein CcmH